MIPSNRAHLLQDIEKMVQCGQRQAKMAPAMRPKTMPSMKLAMIVRL